MHSCKSNQVVHARKIITKITTFCWLLMPSFSLPISAEVNDVSLTLLRGHNYEVGEPERTLLTFEYFHMNDWGDYFMFVDRVEPDGDDGSTYMELSPRFKLMNFDDSVINSLYVTTTWEHGDTADNILIGPAVDINVPGFNFIKLNFYRRFNDLTDDNYQFTPVWAYPFKIGEHDWLFDGVIDWTNSTPQSASSFFLSTQIKWNANGALGISENFFIGTEYIYWNNKFGIQGVNENNLNLLFKYHF